jgi:hypothetical protein
MIKPKLTLKTITDGSVKAAKNISDLSQMRVYVGIPESRNARQHGRKVTNSEILFFNTNGVRSLDARRIMGATMINRGISYKAARDLYVQSKGSMAFQIPPRPVIEPAIEAPENQEAIVRELKQCGIDMLDGKRDAAVTDLRRAGMEGQNRARAWFDDPRNGWAPNAQSTIRRKGSAKPLIQFDEMRKSIIYVLANE